MNDVVWNDVIVKNKLSGILIDGGKLLLLKIIIEK